MPEYRYVHLIRRFGDIGSSDPDDDPAAAMLLGLQGKKQGNTWDDILKLDAAIVLGAAGSGKTTEVLNQAAQLRAEGTYSFVLRLEALCRQPLHKSFVPGDIESPLSFTTWRKRGGKAVVFLDALDEARLPQAKNTSALLDALSHLSEGVGRGGANLKLVITTRGSEWQGSADLALVTSGLRRLRELADKDIQPKVSVFRLSNLNVEDIRAIANSRDVEGDRFIQAVNASLSANLMRQPLEVHFLLDLWKEEIARGKPPEKAFSSRSLVFERIVSTRLRAEHGQERRSNVDPISARRACEKLAAAVVVSGVRDLSAVGESPHTMSALQILATDTDRWSEMETRQLLSCALFHPSVGGSIRFAHRELQDYLAASFFGHAIDTNAGSLEVVSPLIATGLGARQVPQSSEHVLGWVATLNPTSRKSIARLKPSLLIETGDPRSLSVDERAEALKAQGALYEDRRFRGEFFYHDDIRKFATPELASAVQSLMDVAKSPEIREFLVEIARFGRMTVLSDRLGSIVSDPGEALRVRTEACFALAEFGHPEHAAQVLQAALLAPQPEPDDTDAAPSWNMFQVAALTYAYRTTATILDVITIIARLTREASNYSSMTSDLIVGLLEQLNDQEKRDWLSVFLRFAWRERNPDHYQMPRVTQRYQMLAPAIGRIVLDLLGKDRTEDIDLLLDALEYLFAVEAGHSISKQRVPANELTLALQPQTRLKHALLRRRITLFDPAKSESKVAFGVVYPIGFGHNAQSTSVFQHEDVLRFCEDMSNARSERDLHLAFEIAGDILSALRDRSQWQRAQDAITSAVKKYGDAELRRSALRRSFVRRLWLRFQHDYRYRMERQVRAIGEGALGSYWRARNAMTFVWRRHAIESGSDRRILLWATRLSVNDLGPNTIEEIKKSYGKAVARWFATGFRAYWRRYPISRDDRATYKAYAGLTGLALEPSEHLKGISADEAANAFGYAFCNLNGFPDWTASLAAPHTETFMAVCIPLLREEFASASSGDRTPSESLSKIAYSTLAIRSAIAPFLFSELQRGQLTGSDDLEIAAHIVARSATIQSAHARDFFRLSFTNAAVSFDFKLAWIWLEALFETDAPAAWDALTNVFGNEWHGSAASVFLGFLGRERRRFSRAEEAEYERDDLITNPRVLGEMVRTSYLIWPPEKDLRHERVYSPGLLDRASERRHYYLQTLVGLNSAEALQVLEALSGDPRLVKFRDTFLYQMDQLVRNSARRLVYSVADAIAFVNGLSKAPTSIAEFRTLVRRHLTSLLFQLRNSDDDESYIFRRGRGSEDDLRNWLSARVRQVGNRFYTVIREQEVAVENRPDLRIHSRNEDLGFISVEIKMADEEHWSGDILMDKIKTQLADQYLLEEGSHTGFYLIANGSRPKEPELDKTGAIKRKAFQKRVNGKLVSFVELNQCLAARAAEVTSRLPGNKIVEVIAIDLSEK